MVRASLPPGFRFHPTDVELVMYYLKRKVMGKKLLFEAITELNIYEFSPEDLPAKSCLKTKDLEWYFFCPRERKYASGSRANRKTETGYWKATGKDRHVLYKAKGVGMVKTLVFHTGIAPNGKRTDWVIHEYRIEDKDLADNGVAQDTHVLCKLFHKNGPGPKNGAQYGAPFEEEDWDDDSEIHIDTLSHDGPSPLVPVLQQKHNSSAALSVVDLGQSSGLSLSEPGQSVICPSVDDMPFDGRNGSVLTSTDPAAAWSSPQNDEIMHLPRPFSEDEVVHLDQGRKRKSLPNSDGSDPFNGLEDLSNLAKRNGSEHYNFSDLAFLELDDLNAPLNFSTESCGAGELQTGGFESCGVGGIQASGLYPCNFTGSGNILTGSLCTNYNTNGDMRQFSYQENFPNYYLRPTDLLQLPKVPSSSDYPENSNVFPMVVHLDQGRKRKSIPNSDGSDPLNGLEDLSNLAKRNGSEHYNFSDLAFLELDDLNAQLNFSTESCGAGEIQTGGFESCGVEGIQASGLYPCNFTGSGNILTGSLCTNYNTNGDMRQFSYQENFPNYDPRPTDLLQLPKVPSSSDYPENSNVFPMGNSCDGRIPAFNLDWTSYKQEEMGNAAGKQERGRSHNF